MMGVKIVKVTENDVGQRLDNFMMRHFRDVPKARIYRAIRHGEVRVNGGRCKALYRLQQGDQVRLPPLKMQQRRSPPQAQADFLQYLSDCILFQNKQIMVINKPAGLPVHGGTSIHLGVIEACRQLPGCEHYLELVHRLDKNTSGCLLLAKKASALKKIQRAFADRTVKKTYLTLVKGRWQGQERWVKAPLKKNLLPSGERIVRVNAEGKPAATLFKPLERFAEMTLLQALPRTGRTHQIRVHTQSVGHPIVCDDKYGDEDFNTQCHKQGLKRMFLHAESLYLPAAIFGEEMLFEAPLSDDLTAFLQSQRRANA